MNPVIADHAPTLQPVRDVAGVADQRKPEWEDRQPLDLAVDQDPQPPDYLAEGRIERGTVAVLSGDTGASKSWLGMDLAVAIASGRSEWLGAEVRPRDGRAMVIDEENPRRLVLSRLRALGLTSERQDRIRYFHQLGVELGRQGGTDTEWVRHELREYPADLLVIDTGIAATAPEVSDNDQVAALYGHHLRPLAMEFGVAILLLLHEKKPQEGGRQKRSHATMGARSWIGQADAQLMVSKRGATTEERLEDGGYRQDTRVTLEVGKLRDGGAERIEVIHLSSVLRDDRALLSAVITNEGEVEAADVKTAQVLDAVCEVLAEDGGPMRKKVIADAVGTDSKDRTFTRALEVGLEKGRLQRPSHGHYGLDEGDA